MADTIRALETIRIAEFPNILWLELTSQDGLTGLGETYFMPESVESYLHDFVAPKLLDQSFHSIDLIGRLVRPYVGTRSPGSEMRGNSALDIALWDLRARQMGKPLYDALGGAFREKIRVYNTCAGSAYMRGAEGQRSSNWGLDNRDAYDDHNGFLTRADELALELLEDGITGMKIWPFDRPAEESNGLHIAAADLKQALQPFEKIRKAVGERMDIMVEFHSLWSLIPAIRIAKALAPFDTYWHEDPIRLDNLEDLKRYAAASPAPVCASETLTGVGAFRDLLATGAAGIIMPDLSWCGGLSEARRIAVLADAWQLPVAPHDCTGPVVLCASTHLCLATPNALIQETVRAYHRGWYRDVATNLPPIEKGFIRPPDGPGLGMALHPDLDRRFSIRRRRSDRKTA
jgi:L-alanine-DL-glutamate epimerase-like enolase superfamily enzyme